MNPSTTEPAGVPNAYQRRRLCSLENAGAVASQMTEQSGRPTAIISTEEIIQPYRIAYLDETDPHSEIIAEYHVAA